MEGEIYVDYWSTGALIHVEHEIQYLQTTQYSLGGYMGLKETSYLAICLEKVHHWYFLACLPLSGLRPL